MCTTINNLIIPSSLNFPSLIILCPLYTIYYQNVSSFYNNTFSMQWTVAFSSIWCLSWINKLDLAGQSPFLGLSLNFPWRVLKCQNCPSLLFLRMRITLRCEVRNAYNTLAGWVTTQLAVQYSAMAYAYGIGTWCWPSVQWKCHDGREGRNDRQPVSGKPIYKESMKLVIWSPIMDPAFLAS